MYKELIEKIENLESKIDKIFFNTLPKEEQEKILIKKRCEEVKNKISLSTETILDYEIYMFMEVFVGSTSETSRIRLLNVCNFYNTGQMNGTMGSFIKVCERYRNKYVNEEDYTDDEIISNLRNLERCGRKTAVVGLEVYKEARKLLKQNKRNKDSLEDIMKNSNIEQLEYLESTYGID